MSRLFRGGWIQRQAAALWMNFLIMGALALAFFTVWGGFNAQATRDEVALTTLKAFAVWALAFLPGWLYIRFLGQRAGALMSEYVLNLHRLGWDAPQYLPEPLETSPFHEEWRKAGGPSHASSHNIYLQKFDAYYGRSTTSGLAAAPRRNQLHGAGGHVVPGVRDDRDTGGGMDRGALGHVVHRRRDLGGRRAEVRVPRGVRVHRTGSRAPLLPE